MPGGGMTEASGGIKKRNAELLFGERARVINPICRLSPDLLLTFFSLRVNHVPQGGTEFRAKANPESTFLRIPDCEWPGDRAQHKFAIDRAGSIIASERERLCFLPDHA